MELFVGARQRFKPVHAPGAWDDRVREAVAGRMEGSDGAPRRSFTYGELWDESDAYVVGWGVQQARSTQYAHLRAL